MANTFLSEDWHSGDLHSALQQGAQCGHMKVGCFLLGKQERIYEAVLDASEAWSKGGSEAEKLGASMTALFHHYSLETIVLQRGHILKNLKGKKKLFHYFSLREYELAEQKHKDAYCLLFKTTQFPNVKMLLIDKYLTRHPRSLKLCLVFKIHQTAIKPSMC